MGQALYKLAQEDPSFHFSRDDETNQTVIEGMGELHLDIIVDRMKREFNVAADIGAPQVGPINIYFQVLSPLYEIACLAWMSCCQQGNCACVLKCDMCGEDFFLLPCMGVSAPSRKAAPAWQRCQIWQGHNVAAAAKICSKVHLSLKSNQSRHGC